MEVADSPQRGELLQFNTWSASGGLATRMSHVTPMATTSSLTSTASFGSKRSSARCEAELIHARGRISQLELELEMTKTRRAVKRARTDHSDEEEGEMLVTQSSATSQELQRLHALDEERQGLAEQLAESQEKLREREREEGEEMARLRALLADLERKERERTSSMEELHAEVCSLSNENRLLCRQLEVARREMEVVRTSLEEQVRAEATAAGDLRERMTGLAGVREKWEAEQERVKELQHKLRQAKHDIQFAESVQSNLLHGESVEREMRQLREENAALRGHADNVGLMRYQLQTLREQVERNRDMERKAVRLEEENKLLRERLTSSGDEESTTGSRCTGMQSELIVLRRREMVLVSQVGELESRLKLVQRSADRAESLASERQSQLAREQVRA
ncbi:hypothetical protein GBAR_LOCUS10300 [Geodia barretti]|uniref:Uncharacterized protein n=1 Tax=Geodia barretti TaxID=519541 RepID=A0AA35RUY8_GEOBA|nr:hypothetical protein GBAR_LOCUS10300 [Geodia barretti]